MQFENLIYGTLTSRTLEYSKCEIRKSKFDQFDLWKFEKQQFEHPKSIIRKLNIRNQTCEHIKVRKCGEQIKTRKREHRNSDIGNSEIQSAEFRKSRKQILGEPWTIFGSGGISRSRPGGTNRGDAQSAAFRY